MSKKKKNKQQKAKQLVETPTFFNDQEVNLIIDEAWRRICRLTSEQMFAVKEKLNQYIDNKRYQLLVKDREAKDPKNNKE